MKVSHHLLILLLPYFCFLFPLLPDVLVILPPPSFFSPPPNMSTRRSLVPLLLLLLLLLTPATLSHGTEGSQEPEEAKKREGSTTDLLFQLLHEFSYVMDLEVEKDAVKLSQIVPEFSRLLQNHVTETTAQERNNSIVHQVIRSLYHAKDHITKDVMASARKVRQTCVPFSLRILTGCRI